MALFAIGDLHLSFGVDKPMDIFKGWHNYVDRLEENWREVISFEDTVVLMGDISWAMNLEEAVKDFSFIENLPGKKIMLKGNHDYWWTTMSKMNAWREAHAFDSISFLYNNSYVVDDISICGTRSWIFEPNEEKDVKVMNREVGRLEASLKAATQKEKLVFLHYPPVSVNATADEIITVLKNWEISNCFYAHLHGASIYSALQGNVNGIYYRLLSADAVKFMPQKIIIE